MWTQQLGATLNQLAVNTVAWSFKHNGGHGWLSHDSMKMANFAIVGAFCWGKYSFGINFIETKTTLQEVIISTIIHDLCTKNLEKTVKKTKVKWKKMMFFLVSHKGIHFQNQF